MSELDSLFKLDGSLDVLDKTVLEKYVAIFAMRQCSANWEQEASCHHADAGA
jgi:hypothetical protein